MGIQEVLPSTVYEEEIVLIHKNGTIIAINDSVYQVKIYRDPGRKIFTTSIENAYRFLQADERKYNDFEDYYFE
ncbi:MAG: hypothetical protein ACFFDS_06520 [Candidatus Thorarchaeota archaeon]